MPPGGLDADDSKRRVEQQVQQGITSLQAGRLEDAASFLTEAIQTAPEHSLAHNCLGIVFRSQGDIDGAIACYESAIRASPHYAEAYNNLGIARESKGENGPAVDNYRSALRHKPDFTAAHNNLANVFCDLGDPGKARTHYEQALLHQPGLAEATDNLGTVLVDLGDYEAAIKCYERTAKLRPASCDTLVNLGNAYKQQGKLAEAEESYDRAGQLEPNNLLHRLRVSSLCPTVFASSTALEQYRDSVHESWTKASRERLSASGSCLTTRLVEPPFELQFLDGNLRALKETYATIFESSFPQETSLRRSGRPRIGIVVTRTHEGIFLKSMHGVLERIRSDIADITIVCSPASVEMIRTGVQRDIDFLPLPHSFAQMVQSVLEASFDVLYYWEIGSDTTNYFLPFLRLAPVQCTSWGVQVTSGIPNVDYYLSSDLVEPPDAQTHYTEQLRRAGTLLSYQFRDPGPSHPQPRSEFGISDEHNLYLCPQQMGKFHPDFDEMIAEILRRDPNGVLVTIEDRHRTASQALRHRLENTVPDVVNRVHFVPRQDRRGYVSLILAADVLLDPPHFGGVNTTYDALTFGKPIITVPSPFHRGRYTLGCYRKMGLAACIADDPAGYVDLAVELTLDRCRRRQLESGIRSASSVLFEDPSAVEEHDRLFEELIDLARSQ